MDEREFRNQEDEGEWDEYLDDEDGEGEPDGEREHAGVRTTVGPAHAVCAAARPLGGTFTSSRIRTSLTILWRADLLAR